MEIQDYEIGPKKVLLVLVPGIALGLLFYGLYAWNQLPKGAQPVLPFITDNDKSTAHNGLAYDRLIQDSPAFSRALQYSKDRQFDKAREQFEIAKKETTDQGALGVIAFQLLTIKEGEGKYFEAIDMLKDIIGKADSYTLLTRSYAFLEMGLVYYQFGDEKITDRIFEGDVYYKALRVPNDAELTYRNLFEESTKLYPVALAELRVADWYVDQIYAARVQKKVTMNQDTQIAYEKIIQERVDAANIDLGRLRELPNEYGKYGPQSLSRKATIVGKMAVAGNTSLGSVDDAFQAALNAYTARPGTDGYARFHYASILAQLDKVKNADRVREVLSPIYTNVAAYQYSSVHSFFKNERKNVLDSKFELVLLASIDPQFRALLMSKGWTTADFAN